MTRVSPEALALQNAIFHHHVHEPIAPRYDGRKGNVLGLTWEEAARNLCDDIGPRPSPLYSLDHIVHGVGTVENNLRWADNKRQNTNQRQHQVSREEYEQVVMRAQELERENASLKQTISGCGRCVEALAGCAVGVVDDQVGAVAQ